MALDAIAHVKTSVCQRFLMTIDELVNLLCASQNKALNPAQELVLRQAWEGKTYNDMARDSVYEVDYLRTTAARLWQTLSKLLDRPISKGNFRAIVESKPLTLPQQYLVDANLQESLSTLELEYPSGPVPLVSRFYIERPPIEQYAYAEITKPASVIRIKAPKEMGKSSLMLRILQQASSLGYHVAPLDLNQADIGILNHPDKFLRWFCSLVAQRLNLRPNLDEYWDEEIGSKISATLYFTWYILEAIDRPIFLALNEVNRVFEYPELARDFLPLLRSWHEEAQHTVSWQKLRLAIVYSTEIYVPLQIHQSPFNVGLPLKLPDFTPEQVMDLAARHGLNWMRDRSVKQLMDLVGGHPALVRIALYHLAREETSLKQLLQNAHTEAGIYRHHLRRHWLTLGKNAELTQAFREVVRSGSGVILQPILAYELESMGLVKLDGEEVRISYELYRRYFERELFPQSHGSPAL
jgi:hypothetical protein